MSYSAIESFVEFCDEMFIAEEGTIDTPYTDGDIIPFNFFGKEMKVKVHLNENANLGLVSKFDEILKTVGSSTTLWNYLYQSSKSVFDEVNGDLYYGGKTCKSGKDLIKSVEKINYIGIYEDTVYVCGEYWIDPEHGFSINFNNGEFKKQKRGISRFSDEYRTTGTGLGQYSDAL